MLQHPTAARGYLVLFGWLINRVGFVGEDHSGFGFILIRMGGGDESWGVGKGKENKHIF